MFIDNTVHGISSADHMQCILEEKLDNLHATSSTVHLQAFGRANRQPVRGYFCGSERHTKEIAKELRMFILRSDVN